MTGREGIVRQRFNQQLEALHQIIRSDTSHQRLQKQVARQQAQQQGAAPDMGGAPAGGSAPDGVVDADFTEVNDDK